jgi:hypothetical protein
LEWSSVPASAPAQNLSADGESGQCRGLLFEQPLAIEFGDVAEVPPCEERAPVQVAAILQEWVVLSPFVVPAQPHGDSTHDLGLGWR